MKKQKIIVVGGATGTGKSKLAINIAKTLGNAEIISADSMQIYRHMDIGTAKCTTEEMAGIPHHMLNIVEPNIEYSVAEWVNATKKLIDEMSNSGIIPIIVGGTGLYIESLIYGYSFNNAEYDTKYREELKMIAENHGNEYLYDMLRQIDSEAAEKIHPNNVKRVIRALEICHNSENGQKSEDTRELQYDVLFLIKSTTDREAMYGRINERVQEMIDSGLENEVKCLIDMGINFDMQSMQGIGYKEWRDYFAGQISLDEVIQLICQHTRNYAKRQLTWFNNRYKDFGIFVENNEEGIRLSQEFIQNN